MTRGRSPKTRRAKGLPSKVREERDREAHETLAKLMVYYTLACAVFTALFMLAYFLTDMSWGLWEFYKLTQSVIIVTMVGLTFLAWTWNRDIPVYGSAYVIMLVYSMAAIFIVGNYW